jgi:hypothetical protein
MKASKIPMPGEGIKHDEGKNRLDLIPTEALEEIGKVYTFGAQKYNANNWRLGFKFSRIIGATLRHFYRFMRGEDHDQESGLLHLAHAGWGILTLISFFVAKRDELDDRYGKTAVKIALEDMKPTLKEHSNLRQHSCPKCNMFLRQHSCPKCNMFFLRTTNDYEKTGHLCDSCLEE